MIKRTLRLLGLPLLLIPWTILLFYPLVYICALVAGYIFKANKFYWFKYTISKDHYATDGETFISHHGSKPLPKGYSWWDGNLFPWLTITPLLNLWHWYWTDKPTTPRPTTF